MLDKRLPPQPGEWIDRSKVLRFRFEGKEYDGLAGDTISSALWVAGVRLLGRSFKYHRPRGLFSAANHDANILLQTAGDTNIRADVTPVRPGMDLKAVNTFGNLQEDRGRFLNLLAPFLPVGFYYKVFHTPKALFPYWERLVRTLTGLGSVNPDNPRIRTAKRYDFCDVLVIGAGPSGLAAGIAAAKRGARVVIVDENSHAGGTLGYQWDGTADSYAKLQGLLQHADSLPNLSLRTGTTAAGYYPDHYVALVDAERMTKMRTRALIVAAGCFEQPAVFRNNDLPGVMLASAAQRLIHRYGAKPFETVVLLAANADGYRAALDFHKAGVCVKAIVDPRPGGECSPLRQAVADAGIRIYQGYTILEALSDRPDGNVGTAVLCMLDAEGTPRQQESFHIGCDGIAMSVGWAPAAGLLYQAGTRMRYAQDVQQFVPAQLPKGVFAAGRVNGIFALEAKLADGHRAGIAAVRELGLSQEETLPTAGHEGDSPSHPYPIFAHPQGKNFVDMDEDLQLKDLENAVQEGFDNIELLKRYSTVGMGPSQGKHSNMNAIRILARLRGEPIEQVGSTTARPFFHPVPLKHLAGRSFSPYRLTPMHKRHEETGARFMHAGDWLRPQYYAPADESGEDAILAEVLAIRNAVGLIDVGTLGKIEVLGPDAGEFLERIYTGKFKNQKVGMTRYVLMCDEAGMVVDDGVAARLGSEHFYVSTTTTGAGAVFREMQRWALRWGLSVDLVHVTGAFAAMNLAGPLSREVLSALTDADLSDAAVPYQAVREMPLAGIPARVMRVGFVGELGYEVHVPAHYGLAVWDGLLTAGAAHGIRPVGVEAQRVLRLEKGHVIIGQDTDGLSNPEEIGLNWAVKDDKPFFVGQRSLAILRKRGLERRLVGFMLPAAHAGPVPRECQLVIRDGRIAGRITSIAFSPSLNRHIGLAYVQPDQGEPGTTFQIRTDQGVLVEAGVSTTPFYDPQLLRQKLPVSSREVAA